MTDYAAPVVCEHGYLEGTCHACELFCDLAAMTAERDALIKQSEYRRIACERLHAERDALRELKGTPMNETEELYTFTCSQYGNTVTLSGKAADIHEVANLFAQFLIGVGYHRDNVSDILDAEYLS